MRPNQQEHQTRRKAARLVNFVMRRMKTFALMRGGIIGAAAVAAPTAVLLLSLGLTERVDDFETTADRIECRGVVQVCGLLADSRVG